MIQRSETFTPSFQQERRCAKRRGFELDRVVVQLPLDEKAHLLLLEREALIVAVGL